MASPTALRVAYRDLLIYKRIWKENFLASFLQPMMFLLGIGIGVGALVDRGPRSAELLDGVSYFGFYASALMATMAMFSASQEAMWPTMDGFQWSYAYKAMVSTPLAPRDVAAGLIVHYAARTLVGGVGVAIVLAFFDETRTWGLLAAIPVSVLTGLAFAVPILAWTSTRTSDQSFSAIMRFGIQPMFLFGGAFYPIEQLPDWLEPVAWVTPLWHGIELSRAAILGGASEGKVLMHLGVLLVIIVGAWLVCTVTFRRRLYP